MIDDDNPFIHMTEEELNQMWDEEAEHEQKEEDDAIAKAEDPETQWEAQEEERLIEADIAKWEEQQIEKNKIEEENWNELMGVPKRLTEMQKRFAEFIVFGGPEGPVSQMEAAKLAGYSHNRARQEGSELMNPRLSPLVAKFVGELKEERLKKFEVNYETHIAELDRIKNMALKKGSFFPQL